MSEHREFIASFEHMGAGVWSVDQQFALEGEAVEVVRCRECVSYDDSIGAGWCWACDCGTQDDGFCHRGERKESV